MERKTRGDTAERRRKRYIKRHRKIETKRERSRVSERRTERRRERGEKRWTRACGLCGKEESVGRGRKAGR